MVGKKLYVGNLAYRRLAASTWNNCLVSSGRSSASGDPGSRNRPQQGLRFRRDGQRCRGAGRDSRLHDQEHGGRRLTVNEAKPREDRGGGGGHRRLRWWRRLRWRWWLQRWRPLIDRIPLRWPRAGIGCHAALRGTAVLDPNAKAPRAELVIFVGLARFDDSRDHSKASGNAPFALAFDRAVGLESRWSSSAFTTSVAAAPRSIVLLSLSRGRAVAPHPPRAG